MFQQLMSGAVRALKSPYIIYLIYSEGQTMAYSGAEEKLQCHTFPANSSSACAPSKSPIALTWANPSVNPGHFTFDSLATFPSIILANHFVSMISSSAKTINSCLINYIERGHCHCHSAKKYKSRTYPRFSSA